jgi:hypothetical protein
VRLTPETARAPPAAAALDEVHVELAHELASVLDHHPHAVVDELEHLGALWVRHGVVARGRATDGG